MAAVSIDDMDFETPKDIQARISENAERADEINLRLYVDPMEAFRFFKEAQINYMKSIFKIYHGIEYVVVHGDDTVVETPHKNNVRQRGPNAPNQEYTTNANYVRDRTHFMELFDRFAEVGFAEEYKNKEKRYSRNNPATEENSLDHAFWNMGSNYDVPNAYLQFRHRNEHNEPSRAIIDDRKTLPGRKGQDDFLRREQQLSDTAYATYINPGRMRDDHVRKILANELLRSAGVLLVFSENSSKYQRDINRGELHDDNDPRRLENDGLLRFLKGVSHATRVLQQVLSSNDESNEINGALFQGLEQQKFDVTNNMVHATIEWYWTTIGFLQPGDYLTQRIDGHDGNPEIWTRSENNVSDIFNARIAEMIDTMRIWHYDAYETLEEIAIKKWVEQYAADHHGQAPTDDQIPDTVPQDGPRPQPVAHLNADTGAWETEENEAEIVVFFNKMYYCTQLYFMYWYRRTDARTKANARHALQNPNGREGIATVLNYFLEYRMVYNRPHDSRGNGHGRVNPRPLQADAHQAAFYEMWTGVQPVVSAKGLLEFPGIDEADGEVQRMLRNNPVWRGNITHGALIPAVAARINALDARARGLHDARREQHRKAETTTAQIKGQPRRR